MRTAPENHDGWFGQRWKSETVHLVIERQADDAVRPIKRACQNRDGCVKPVSFNAQP